MEFSLQFVKSNPTLKPQRFPSTISSRSTKFFPFQFLNLSQKRFRRSVSRSVVVCGTKPEPWNHLPQKLGTLLTCAVLAWIPPQGIYTFPASARTLTAEEQRTVKLFNSSTSSVVNVTNLGTRQDAFTLDIMEIPQGAGTGIIWDSDGHIITNFHVIQKATEVQVISSSSSKTVTFKIRSHWQMGTTSWQKSSVWIQTKTSPS